MKVSKGRKPADSTSMIFDDKAKDDLLKKEFPKLSDEEREKMKEFLDDYMELVVRVYERQQREKKNGEKPQQNEEGFDSP